METTYQTKKDFFNRTKESESSTFNLWPVPVGRFFFSLIFVMSGLSHFSAASISYAANSGVPLPDILVPISGIIAIAGGLSVMLGFHARAGGVLILLFLLPVTLLMHDFWSIADAQQAQNQFSHFMKNLALIGGALLITFYGAGPGSVDHYLNKKQSRS